MFYVRRQRFAELALDQKVFGPWPTHDDAVAAIRSWAEAKGTELSEGLPYPNCTCWTDGEFFFVEPGMGSQLSMEID